jgi:methyltransferase (TIGR00027 family)
MADLVGNSHSVIAMATDKLISDVADTARWVAVYRAMETERPDALFRDPYARRLAGEKGEQIVRGLKRGRGTAWPMIVRTVLLDEIVRREVASGTDTVLNLAAGLDTRAYRMELPSSLHWIDVDQAHMVEYKSNAMAHETPVCRYESVPLDLADAGARRALFARVNAQARRTLVITEGLLIYLTADDVIGLARDLHAADTFTRWASDLASPGLLKMMSRTWGKAVAAGDAPFRFGPAEGPAFFTSLGWTELEYHPFLDEAIRLNRAFPMARFWRWVGSLTSAKRQAEWKHFAGVMLLGRN